MNVINLILTNRRGGMEQAFVNYAKMLKAAGYNVINVVSYDMQPNYIDQLKAIDTKVISMRNILGFWDLALAMQLHYLLIKNKASIVIAHAGRSITLARWAVKGVSCRLIGVNHSNKIRRSLMCDGVFVVNSAQRDIVIENEPNLVDKTFIMPNAIEIPPETLPFRESNRPVVIGSIGRLEYGKGFNVLLESAHIMMNRGLDFRIVITGEGSELENLKRHSKLLGLGKIVEFRKWTNNKADLYRDIDIFCLPSLEESFGIVILEAMLNRRPVVSNACDGPRDIICDGETGLLVNIDSDIDELPKRIADSLGELISDENLRRRLSENARRHVVSNYNIKDISEKLKNAIYIICDEYN